MSRSRLTPTGHLSGISAVFIIVLTALGLLNSALAVDSVTLAWNPSSSTAVSGYYVYAWEEDAIEPIKIDAGSDSFAAVNGLKEGLSYTFRVTAYNAYGLESQPSAGLPYRVPVPLRMMQPLSNSSAPSIQFPAAPGRWYELQASTDLSNWTTIWQTGIANNYSQMEYQDPRSRYYPSRFYRLLVH